MDSLPTQKTEETVEVPKCNNIDPDTLAMLEDIKLSDFEDPDEEWEKRLRQLLDVMEAAIEKPQWDNKHYKRILFTNLSSIKKIRKEGDVYVKENYLPEYKYRNRTHPIQDVLFIGIVEKMDLHGENLYLQIRGDNSSITVVADTQVNEKCDYSTLHKEFRKAEEQYNAACLDNPPIPDIECSVRISEVRWLLARRRKECDALVVVDRKKILLNKTILITGKMAELKNKRCIYMKQYVVMPNTQVKDWIQKALNDGCWYEDEFKAQSK